ncbi:MAG: AraC family transcriptional regulator [Christensenellales bacterium]|jgi:two-component system response regulator YesN
MGSSHDFDLNLAIECADALAFSTSLGCSISTAEGEILHSIGSSIRDCSMCERIGLAVDSCTHSQIYATASAERFGGKYVYFCPGGLTCAISPILGQFGPVAKLTIGPFLMMDKADYVRYDLKESLKLEGKRLESCLEVLDNIPEVDAKRVNYISNLLFMSVGFINNVVAAGRMLEAQHENEIQGQISDYIHSLKQKAIEYPYETEKELLHSIATSNRENAQRLLNIVLGNIFLAAGNDLSRIRSRVIELLVLISRAAVDGGANIEYALQLNHNYIQSLHATKNLDKLCFQLTNAMNNFIDCAFRYSGYKHFDIMHKTLAHIRTNYMDKLTLGGMASMVYLSPSYFSRIFKEEQGVSFSEYLTNYRIKKSKVLLLNKSIRIGDVSAMVGFEDQSYFTKVFKRLVGISPSHFRDTNGRLKQGVL